MCIYECVCACDIRKDVASSVILEADNCLHAEGSFQTGSHGEIPAGEPLLGSQQCWFLAAVGGGRAGGGGGGSKLTGQTKAIMT